METKRRNKPGVRPTHEIPSRDTFNEVQSLYPEWSKTKVLQSINPHFNKDNINYILRKWNQEDRIAAEKEKLNKNFEEYIVESEAKQGLIVSPEDPDKRHYQVEDGRTEVIGDDALMRIETGFNVSKSAWLQSQGEILRSELKIKVLQKLRKDAENNEWKQINLMGRLISEK